MKTVTYIYEQRQTELRAIDGTEAGRTAYDGYDYEAGKGAEDNFKSDG